MKKRTFAEVDHQIIGLIYELFEILGEQSDLLSIIGSWKETLDDEDILIMLKEYVESKKAKFK